MAELLNYTPHAELTWRPDDTETVVLPQRGNARCAEEFVRGGALPNGLPLTITR